MRPGALKGGGEALKGYWTEVEGDQEALNNIGGLVTVDGEALKGDEWRFMGEVKAFKTKKCR